MIAPALSHSERSKLSSRPCTAHDQTFGGRCLNCGHGEPAPRAERISWPSIDAVLEELVGVRDTVAPAVNLDGDPEDAYVDVRLRVYADGWEVLSGSAQYDTDHRGFIGATSIAREDSKRLLREKAKDLLEEAKDAEATSRLAREAEARS